MPRLLVAYSWGCVMCYVYPFDMLIGVVTAILGVPFFPHLIRTRGGESHR